MSISAAFRPDAGDPWYPVWQMIMHSRACGGTSMVDDGPVSPVFPPTVNVEVKKLPRSTETWVIHRQNKRQKEKRPRLRELLKPLLARPRCLVSMRARSFFSTAQDCYLTSRLALLVRVGSVALTSLNVDVWLFTLASRYFSTGLLSRRCSPSFTSFGMSYIVASQWFQDI